MDILKVLMYRPEYFGAQFCRIGQSLMRSSSEFSGWRIGERELMGAFTSAQNHCVF